MTSNELRFMFNNLYGMNEWPSKYTVDHETYANVCQECFNQQREIKFGIAKIALGINRGIMFKGVELILGAK